MKGAEEDYLELEKKLDEQIWAQYNADRLCDE